jgi:prevent-host-death family protein
MELGLREANQQFAKVIRTVRAGREVVLTDRGRPIAVIRPIDDVDDTERMLKRLEAEGLIQRATVPGPMRRWKPLRIKGASLSRAVLEDREESL